MLRELGHPIVRYTHKVLLLLPVVVMLVCPAGVLADETKNFIERWQIGPEWTGDFDQMVERRLIRVLVVYNKMMFFFDQARIRGTAYEALREFEKYINAKLNTGTRKIKVVFLPVTRDHLLPWLVEGRGDIAVANLTITKNRKKIVAFSRPLLSDISEIIVTGPTAAPVDGIASLAGKEIHVRFSSSYFEHLNRLNDTFRKQGREPVSIIAASEYLEDADLLEMVNAGLIPMVVVDDHKAQFWAQIFDDITLHPDITINTGGKIAWAMRPGSPKLEQIANIYKYFIAYGLARSKQQTMQAQ